MKLRLGYVSNSSSCAYLLLSCGSDLKEVARKNLNADDANFFLACLSDINKARAREYLKDSSLDLDRNDKERIRDFISSGCKMYYFGWGDGEGGVKFLLDEIEKKASIDKVCLYWHM